MTQYLLAIHTDGLPRRPAGDVRQSFRDVEALDGPKAWRFPHPCPSSAPRYVSGWRCPPLTIH
jgi:hypothetical protein